MVSIMIAVEAKPKSNCRAQSSTNCSNNRWPTFYEHSYKTLSEMYISCLPQLGFRQFVDVSSSSSANIEYLSFCPKSVKLHISALTQQATGLIQQSGIFGCSTKGDSYWALT